MLLLGPLPLGGEDALLLVLAAPVARALDWQHFLGHFSQRVSPANLNSTGLM